MSGGKVKFMRRFLLHVLPRGSIASATTRLLANATRKAGIAQARQLL